MYKGAAQVRKSLPEASSIFILPLPLKFGATFDRPWYRQRRSYSNRLPKARHEIEQSVLFDYVVVNDDLDRCRNRFVPIIKNGPSEKSAQQELSQTCWKIRKTAKITVYLET